MNISVDGYATLGLEQYRAIKNQLDLIGISQNAAAKYIGVSGPTLSRRLKHGKPFPSEQLDKLVELIRKYDFSWSLDDHLNSHNTTSNGDLKRIALCNSYYDLASICKKIPDKYTNDLKSRIDSIIIEFKDRTI